MANHPTLAALVMLLVIFAPPVAGAGDESLPLVFKSEHSRDPAKASLVQTCSPADERKGLCRPRFVAPDPHFRMPKATAEEYRARGSGFLQEGYLDRALEDFDEAIRLKPDYAEAFNSRGCAYLAMQQYGRALADFDTAIKLAPGLALAFFNRAETYKAMGDRQRAVRDYDAYVRLEPGDVDGYAHRSFAHRQLGHFDEAISDLNEAVRLKPKDAALLNLRCWLRAVAGSDLEVALGDCNLSLRLRPDSCETLDSRGFVYFRMGQFGKAIADNTAALKINPKRPSSLFVRGLAKSRTGDRSADADIAAALAMDPRIAGEYQGYGVGR